MKEPLWREHLTDREREELEWLMQYKGHGTDGHNRIQLIQKMAKLLDGGLIPAVIKSFDPSRPTDASKKPPSMA